ncbi:FliH/SctL family protein [Halobacteriovorax sp.]|uniref:FliH/SctL family protein n=1 Tax=Halobacteriovorax sp. TaxID=2020862 RepID=UPI003565A12E
MSNDKDNIFGEVSEYEFKSFSTSSIPSGEVTNFEFSEIGSLKPATEDNHQKVIKIERDYAEKNDFKIAPIVKEHRGITKQVLKERELRIEQEVERRVQELKEEAYNDGYNEGMASGREEVFNQNRASSEEKIQNLTNMIVDVLGTRSDLLVNQKKQVYSLVRILTKWVILRELTDDGKYIENLLEKLITEMQTKSNLLVHVDEKSFEQMPEVLKVVQNKIGELTNVRVEIDYDIEGPGIVLECDKGILNGTINQQMKSLDKLFETVGLEQEKSINMQELNIDQVDSTEDDNSGSD